MKGMIIVAAFILGLVFVPPPAQAAVDWNNDWGCSADGSGCGGYDEVLGEGANTGGGSGEYTLGESYQFCLALRLNRETCKGCTFNQYNALKCSAFEWSGSCQCKQERRPGAAPGITDCSSLGTCTYHQF